MVVMSDSFKQTVRLWSKIYLWKNFQVWKTSNTANFLSPSQKLAIFQPDKQVQTVKAWAWNKVTLSKMGHRVGGGVPTNAVNVLYHVTNFPNILVKDTIAHMRARNGESFHYSDVIRGAMASQITSLTIVYSTVYSGAGQRKHQSSASLTFVRGIHRWPVNSPHKGPVTWKMFPFDDVIMCELTVWSLTFTSLL